MQRRDEARSRRSARARPSPSASVDPKRGRVEQRVLERFVSARTGNSEVLGAGRIGQQEGQLSGAVLIDVEPKVDTFSAALDDLTLQLIDHLLLAENIPGLVVRQGHVGRVDERPDHEEQQKNQPGRKPAECLGPGRQVGEVDDKPQSSR